MIRVVVVDDHPVVRQGVSMVLSAQDDIEVVATASSGPEAQEVVRTHRPDVVLMDLSMPDGDGDVATRAIVAEHPGIAVVVLTSFSDSDRVREALDAGAVGYLLKDCEPEDLASSVRAAARGEAPLHPRAARVALERRAAPSASSGLTERERDVLRLVSKGFTNGQIGTRLGVSERTIKGHLTNIFTRLGVTDRTSAALWAQRHLSDLSER